jgi:hypothetical protein
MQEVAEAASHAAQSAAINSPVTNTNRLYTPQASGNLKCDNRSAKLDITL